MVDDKQPVSCPAWVVEDPDGRKVIIDLESVLGAEWVYNGVVDVAGAMITVALWPADAAGNPAELPPDPDPPPPPSPRSRDW